MKHKAILLITFLLCTLAVYRTWTQGDTHDHIQRADTIADSAVHDNTIFIPVREVEDDLGSDSSSDSDDVSDPEPARLSREMIIQYAEEQYGVSEEWVMWLIGTTWREDYHEDRYLEYAWACEIVNEYSHHTVWQLDGIWGDYYTIDKAFAGYYEADDICLEMVWEALTDPDTRIVEVDGMIRWYVEGYYLIYDSEVYNCQVWGR